MDLSELLPEYLPSAITISMAQLDIPMETHSLRSPQVIWKASDKRVAEARKAVSGYLRRSKPKPEKKWALIKKF